MVFVEAIVYDLYVWKWLLGIFSGFLSAVWNELIIVAFISYTPKIYASQKHVLFLISFNIYIPALPCQFIYQCLPSLACRI